MLSDFLAACAFRFVISTRKSGKIISTTNLKPFQFSPKFRKTTPTWIVPGIVYSIRLCEQKCLFQDSGCCYLPRSCGLLAACRFQRRCVQGAQHQAAWILFRGQSGWSALPQRTIYFIYHGWRVFVAKPNSDCPSSLTSPSSYVSSSAYKKNCLAYCEQYLYWFLGPEVPFSGATCEPYTECTFAGQKSLSISNSYSLSGTLTAKVPVAELEAAFNLGATYTYSKTSEISQTLTSTRPNETFDDCGYWAFLPYYVTKVTTSLNSSLVLTDSKILWVLHYCRQCR